MPVIGPIFVPADDLLVFRSKEEAESSIEPIDVEPDQRAYDSEGRLLHVVVRGAIARGRWSVDQSRARVELVPAEVAADHPEELRTLLVDWIYRAETAKSDVAGMGLQDLVQRAQRVASLQAAQSMRTSKVLAWLAVLVAAGVVVWWWLIR